MDVGQLFYPKKLYNYLRNHHWKKGIPEDFAINWLNKAKKDFSDPKETLRELQVILNKLHLSYSVSNIDLERRIESEKKEDNPSEKPEIILTSKQLRKTHAIPSIDNFDEFKEWMLNKLTELEKIV